MPLLFGYLLFGAQPYSLLNFSGWEWKFIAPWMSADSLLINRLVIYTWRAVSHLIFSKITILSGCEMKIMFFNFSFLFFFFVQGVSGYQIWYWIGLMEVRVDQDWRPSRLIQNSIRWSSVLSEWPRPAFLWQDNHSPVRYRILVTKNS